MIHFRSACVRACVRACQGMAETFGSTCHGAGRAQSRNRSRNNLSYEDVLASLASTHAYADAHRCPLLQLPAGTGVDPLTSMPGLGPDHAASAPGMATPLPTSAEWPGLTGPCWAHSTSAPGLGSPRARLRNRAKASPPNPTRPACFHDKRGVAAPQHHRVLCATAPARVGVRRSAGAVLAVPELG